VHSPVPVRPDGPADDPPVGGAPPRSGRGQATKRRNRLTAHCRAPYPDGRGCFHDRGLPRVLAPPINHDHRKRAGEPCDSYGVDSQGHDETPASQTARRLRRQAVACAHLGSPLYAELLDHAADDLLSGGPTAEVLAGNLADPWRSALALRMLGGVHALVLTGRAPDLAVFYPSAGGTAAPGPGGGDAWAALRRLLAEQPDAIRSWLGRPPQTNEVGRAAALLGGLRQVVAEARLPVRLVEIGASAGLNLRADRFCVPGDAGSYGDPSSPVVLTSGWRGQPPPDAPVEVIERTGGDRAPIDPATPHGRLTLAAYVWPDQPDRMARLRGAFAVAAAIPADLRREAASDTVHRTVLAEGSWTVLWHSIVRQYLDDAQRTAVADRIAMLGADATPAARFAYLFLEPHRPTAESECLVSLTTWPGGDQRIIGTAPPHGLPTTWKQQE